MSNKYYDWRECRDQDIVEAFNKLGGEWTNLVKGGSNRVRRVKKERPLCINPQHADTHAGSFALDRKKGVFYCQACGCGGSIIDMVMLAKGCSFQEAIQWLGDEFKLNSTFKPEAPEFEEHEHMLAPEDGALIGLCKIEKHTPYFPVAAPEEEVIWTDDAGETEDSFTVIKNPRWSPLRSLYYSKDAEDKEMYYYLIMKNAFITKERIKQDWEHLSSMMKEDPEWKEAWFDAYADQFKRANELFFDALKWYRRYHKKTQEAASA